MLCQYEEKDFRRMESDLRMGCQMIEALSFEVSAACILFDMDGNVLWSSRLLRALFGWEPSEAACKRLPIVPEELREAFDAMLRESGWNVQSRETVKVRRDGTRFAAIESVMPVLDSQESIVAYASIIRDLTSCSHAEKLLKENEQRYRSLFEHNPNAIFSLDLDGRFTSANPAVEVISGYRLAELANRDYSFFAHGDDLAMLTKRFQLAKFGNIQHFDMEIEHRWGHKVDLAMILLPIFVGDSIQGVHCLAQDITKRKQDERMINYMAYHDYLTGLPNRRKFYEHMQTVMKEADSGQDAGFTILVVDLDGFKSVNDTYGHAAGDEALLAAAGRLKLCVGESDMVARMGGDEFIVVLQQTVETERTSGIVREMLEELTVPYRSGDKSFRVSASIGVAVYPADGKDLVTLLRKADIAMYSVKESGKNGYAFSTSPAYNQDYRLMLEGLERNEFMLHYQPQVNTRTGKIEGVEALIRWQHPEQGLLYPGSFIEKAEKNGCIAAIGEWVLRTACRQGVEWHEQGFGDLRMAVNVSVRQFHQDDFVAKVLAILEETGFPARQLEIEITESVLMSDSDTVIAKMRHLADHGVRIAVDDFGTGFSSLTYILKLPIHKLKIDRTFIADIQNRRETAIVSSVVHMANQLNLEVIVEGVETNLQREKLPALGCHQMQGYYFGRPLPPESFCRYQFGEPQ